MKSLNEFIVLAERTMTKKEKSKEDRLKDKYDDSDMKNNMKDQYGEEEGEKVYYATIRKQAMKKEEVVNEIAPALAVAGGLAAAGTVAGGALAGAGKVVGGAISGAGSIAKGSIKAVKKVKKGIEEPVEEGVIDAVKKGAKRHAKAVQAKKIKDRKAVPYAALAAEHEPEGEMVEDYHSGQGEKIQKRTLAWMKKKGQKGAPGLDAMKARTAEHKAKRGVKEEAGCETKKIENKGKKKIDPNKNPVVEAKVDDVKYSKDEKRKNYETDVHTLSVNKGVRSDRNKRRSATDVIFHGHSKVERDRKQTHYKSRGVKKVKGVKEEVVDEAKVDKGRSDYGKATIRNWRHSGPSTVEPAMFDPENKRGKTIEKRREEHKARRGVKGAKVPTYKKESFSDWRTDLGEEGYDRWRDDRLVKYGIGHDGSDRKGSSSYSPRSKQKGDTAYQKEMKKKHGGKLPSAIDVVKARIEKEHGKGAVMDTKKSKG